MFWLRGEQVASISCCFVFFFFAILELGKEEEPQKQDGKFGISGFAKGCKHQILVLQQALLSWIVFCFGFCPLDRTFFFQLEKNWILSEISSWINGTLCERLAVGIFPLSFATLHSKGWEWSRCRITALISVQCFALVQPLRTAWTPNFSWSLLSGSNSQASSPGTNGLTHVT